MSLSINNNITALNAWRNLKSTDGKMSATMEKLSSGLRINKAADDPAGLVISEKMRAQLVGLNAAMKNSEKAINMVQTAEAALDNVQKLLDKMRQLAIDTANSGVNDDAMKKANQDELDQAVDSITRIANYTQFGTKKLLDGSLGTTVDLTSGAAALTAEIGAISLNGVTDPDQAGAANLTIDQIAKQSKATLAITDTTPADDAIDAVSTLEVNGVSFSFAAGTTYANMLTTINAKSDETGVSATIAADTLTLTATQYGSAYDLTGNITRSGSLAAATITETGKDMIATLDFANGDSTTLDGSGLTIADATGNQMVFNGGAGYDALTVGGAGYAMGNVDVNNATFQVGANELQTVTMTIQSVKATALGIAATYGDDDAGVTSFTNLEDLKTGAVFTSGTADELAQAIGVIDKAIDEVSSLRGTLGAMQGNNLQVQLDALRVSYENLQSAESTIRDTDMTMEMANFTKYQIMMQAGTAMLAQANQMPQTILQLLG